MMNEVAICEKAELLYHKMELVSSAEEYCRVLVCDPMYRGALFALPTVLAKLEKVGLACRWASRLADGLKYDRPSLIQAASILYRFGQHDSALLINQRSICLNPASFEVCLMAAECHLNCNDNVKTEARYLGYCFKLSPENNKAKLLLAVKNRIDENFRDSIKILSSLDARENDEVINFELGKCYLEINDLESAISRLQKCIIQSPGNFDYLFELSTCYFKKSDFETAWKFHEKRVFIFYGSLGGRAGGQYLHDCRWFSGPTASGRVLVWADEGIGDEIKFGSLLNEFQSRASTLLVQLDSRLVPLFRRSLPRDIDYVSRDDLVPPERYDYHVPIGSLGRYVRPTTVSFLAGGSKFLLADKARVIAMRELLAKQPGERLVGISWRSTNPVTGRARSLALKDLVASIHASNARLINLQYGDVDAEISAAEKESGILVWRCPRLDLTNDLDGVAALIEACDEVITIGNTTAHLAGALGKKTTVIVKRIPNWRWLEQDGRSLWYQSVRVITWSGGVLYNSPAESGVC